MNHIRLDLARILSLSHITHRYCAGANGFQRQFVYIRDILQLAVGIDVVVVWANLCISRRQNQVRTVYGAHDIHGTEVVSLQLKRVDIDHDLAVFASEGRRHRGSRYSRQLVTHRKLPRSRSWVSLRPCPFNVIRHTGRLDASNFSTTGGSVPGGKRRRLAMARFEIMVTSESGL